MRIMNRRVRVLAVPFIILMLMVFIIPQSFMFVKLPFLGVLLLAVVAEGMRGHFRLRVESFNYYLIFTLLACIWSVVGAVRGNDTVAIIESLRVYVLYMWIYAALVMYLSSQCYHANLDAVITAGSIGIFLLAIYALSNHLFGLNWLGVVAEEELYLQVGVHEGYTQLNNVDIGMLTFILPYLLSRTLVTGGSKLLLLGVGCALIAAVLASRRIVLLLFLLTPLLTSFVALLSGVATKKINKRVIRFYGVISAICLLVGGVIAMGGSDPMGGFLARVLDIFVTDSDSPRQLQYLALLEGFKENYLIGSGFGGVVSVIRSYERPWTFELTYSRLLFNAGSIGFTLLLTHFLYYTWRAVKKTSNSVNWVHYVPMLTGLFSVLLASASNPYLTSFDFLFPLSIVPLILNTREPDVYYHQESRAYSWSVI